MFPTWDVPGLGGALVIAGISIVHVVIAHFAVGAGIFNALSEARANKHNDQILLSFIKQNSKFLIYFSFVAGAVTGVGIWFSISLVSPIGTSYLIRLFLWAWAIEWIFFAVELVAGYVYYYTWDRLSPRVHNFVGWIYAFAAFMSLVMINGILTFMLTTGDFPITQNFWDAWLNPSFFPSLFLRTVSSLSFAGIFVAIVVAKTKAFDQSEKEKIIAWGAKFLLPLSLMPFLAFWYFETIPVAARELATGGAVAMTFIFAFGVITSFLIAVFAYFGMLRKARDINFETAILMCTIAFIATGSMEFVREGIRKPYLIPDILYSNGIFVKDIPHLNQEGILASTKWIRPDTIRFKNELLAKGEAVYRAQCVQCHQIEGYNAMTPLVKDWNETLVNTALDHLDEIKGFMPPFIGNDEEKKALSAYLLTLGKSSKSEQTK